MSQFKILLSKRANLITDGVGRRITVFTLFYCEQLGIDYNSPEFVYFTVNKVKTEIFIGDIEKLIVDGEIFDLSEYKRK